MSKNMLNFVFCPSCNLIFRYFFVISMFLKFKTWSAGTLPSTGLFKQPMHLPPPPMAENFKLKLLFTRALACFWRHSKNPQLFIYIGASQEKKGSCSLKPRRILWLSGFGKYLISLKAPAHSAHAFIWTAYSSRLTLTKQELPPSQFSRLCSRWFNFLLLLEATWDCF